MDPLYKRMTEFLVDLGLEQIGHTQKTYLGHLLAVHRFMKEQGCDEELCRAGMFHSIYGTQMFQGFTLPIERRPELRALIGERAERIAYLNCAMYRPSLDDILDQESEPYVITDRITSEQVALSRRDFDDLCRVHLHDWLEQVPRSRLGWDYRRAAFRRMAERLGETATKTYDRIFAMEPAPLT